MKSRTSCFNSTVFKKNLTRFAPVWGLYTLCLILGVLLIYNQGGTTKQYWFAANYCQILQIGGVLNLGYGLLTAQLLFGDLYNSRMCNALHALPLRRESWFFTNIFSGLLFSLVPTAVMTLLGLALTSGSIVVNAWQIPMYVFLGMNLQYICFFGLAVLSAMCAGNRVSMIVVYGILNFGAFIVYWLIVAVYTPMLYGIVTPSALAEKLTPFAYISAKPFIQVTDLGTMHDKFGFELVDASAEFWLGETFPYLFYIAGAGIAAALLALVLYKKRDLECAGDAMAFRVLNPVVLTLFTVCAGAAAMFLVQLLISPEGALIPMGCLAIGTVVGWFVGQMFIARSARVFAPRNWVGLGAIAAAFVLTLTATHFDILGLETRMPDADEIASVSFAHTELTQPGDVEKMLRVQEIALQDRVENFYTYMLDKNGVLVRYEYNEEEDAEKPEPIYTAGGYITFTLKNGKEIQRRYPVWMDSEAGDILRQIESRWEYINGRYDNHDGDKLEMALSTLDEIMVQGTKVPKELVTRETAESLVAALKADCEAGTMAQGRGYHHGSFYYPAENEEDSYTTDDIYIQINGQGKYYTNYWSINVYPDSENTMNWLREHDLLAFEIRDEDVR